MLSQYYFMVQQLGFPNDSSEQEASFMLREILRKVFNIFHSQLLNYL